MEMIQEMADGDRSERSERRAPSAGAGLAAEAEIPAVGRKRRYTTAYKLKVLAEAERCGRGELGALLRREGLYHSTIIKWRSWRAKMSEQGLEPASKGQSQRELRNQLKRLERENRRLTLRLKRTEGLVDLQKKALKLLEELDQGEENETSS